MLVHTARLSYLLTQLDYGRFCVCSRDVAVQVRIEARSVILLTISRAFYNVLGVYLYEQDVLVRPTLTQRAGEVLFCR